MDKLGTNFLSHSSVPNGKEASDMNRPEYDALDQALADLYGDGPSLRFEKNWREAVKREEQTKMKQKKNTWKKVVLPIAAALVLVLGAGWAGTMEEDISYNASIAPREKSSKIAYDAGSDSYTGGTALMSMAAAPGSGSNGSYTEYSAVNSDAYDMAAEAPVAEAVAGSAISAPADNRKLIRTVDLSLRTETFEQDVESIQQLLLQYGGYIENLHQQGEAGSRYGRSASLTMRVPSQHLDAFLEGISGFGRITSRSETTEDMTEQYADNEMRIQTLRTKMERLTTLLSQAEDVSDMLEIESEIADTQYQLDRFESQQLNIDRRVDMSYVYVNVQETIVQDEVDDEELSLGQRLKAAFASSIEGLTRFGRNLLVFLVMAAPVIVPVAVIVLMIKLVKRNRKAQKESHDLLEDMLKADAMDESDEENE